MNFENDVIYWICTLTETQFPVLPHSLSQEQPQAPKSATATTTTSSKIPFRLARLTAQGRSTLRLVKGTSTNTVNTVEDTELSSNERKCIEVTSFYTSTDEVSDVFHLFFADFCLTLVYCSLLIFHSSSPLLSIQNPTSSAPQITTVSHVIGEIDDDQNDETTAMNSKADDSPTDASVTSVCAPRSTPQQICNLVTQVQLSMVSHVSPGGQKSQKATTLALSKQSSNNPHTQVSRRKETLKAKRERKAAKTLAIITGAFVICWLPFFIMALVMALCNDCDISDTMVSFFLWLGYFNSTLNPVIYTIFSPEFRQAFKRILCGTRRNAYHRSGKF